MFSKHCFVKWNSISGIGFDHSIFVICFSLTSSLHQGRFNSTIIAGRPSKFDYWNSTNNVWPAIVRRSSTSRVTCDWLKNIIKLRTKLAIKENTESKLKAKRGRSFLYWICRSLRFWLLPTTCFKSIKMLLRTSCFDNWRGENAQMRATHY